MDNEDVQALIGYLTVDCKNWASTATMDDEFEDDNGDTITVRDVIGDENIEPDENADILDGSSCEMLDLPRGSTVAHACNVIRNALTRAWDYKTSVQEYINAINAGEPLPALPP